MPNADLVDRLEALPNLDGVPREELEWLVANGDLAVYETGAVVAPKGKQIETLWVILSGHISVQVDRGVGPRRVIGWRTGEVSGMLPYSRMTGPPGDNYVEDRSELLVIHEKRFPEMIQRCPKFTAYTVHLMLDRARQFNASDLQDEKMISLGKLAAGLAHELNNPASATVRGARMLLADLDKADEVSRALGATELTPDLAESIVAIRQQCLTDASPGIMSPLAQADREDAIADWLSEHQCEPALAPALAETVITLEMLDTIAEQTSGETLNTALNWIAVGCQTRALANDIETAANRIHELVAAVKRFTHMDNLAGPEFTAVSGGISDTVRVVASKAKAKGAAITVTIEPDLPRVRANGGDLNQIWMNLIDNALDAIPQSGHIDICARKESNRVVVSVVDDGHGIPPGVLEQIFDPFFTTKPPGEGTGLGLELTRRLIRRYQGDIEVQSRAGRTEFRVRLLPELPNIENEVPT